MSTTVILEEVEARFKFSGDIIKRFGEESVSNKNVAILELIKNSYDAGATKVHVALHGINTSTPKITISDNGEGMSYIDIENKWMNIATSSKRDRVHKTDERVPVGEKGIGRLSSESLGDYTVLDTKPKNEAAGYRINFDWLEYQKKGVLANEVKNKGVKYKKTKADSGTTLEISKLRHDWNDIEVQKSLLNDIYSLHPPTFKPKNFSISTSFSASLSLKKIDKNFLSNAAYHVKVSLSAGNILKFECKAINGKSSKGQLKLDKKLSCGDATFELYFFYRKEAAYISNLNHSISSLSIKDIVETLDEYCGIKIYRDNFRVKPYGENGNDWLGLDLSFQNNSIYPRNVNVFGWVNISKLHNSKIVDTTTREGIVLSNEFQDLIRFAHTSIGEIFIPFRSDIEIAKKKAQKKVAKKAVAKKVKAAPTKTLPVVDDKLIKDIGGNYPQNFYTALEQEINDCYKSNYPNAAFFLSRKLIENLIFNILETKYPNDTELFYDTKINSHLKLSLLIKNLYSKKDDFKPNIQKYISNFNIQVGKFRKEANSKAHNLIEYLSDKSELKQFKINDLVQLLINVYNGI